VKIAVVKYNAGNIHSVRLALRRLGIEPLITDDAGELKRADKVIFPGVGEARSAMAYLRQHGLDTVLTGLRQPVLGICLGLQLMCRHSEENDTQALGIFAEQVLRFPPREKVPHMGWNSITNLRGPLFDQIADGSYVYFVHSYFADTGKDTTAQTDYIIPFSSALCRDNFFAVQFHPEKSGETGAQILRNFISL
jgi:glutamine amidotransferase